MIWLRLISLPYVRRHLLRTLLMLTGIAIGVAVFVGMHTANQSVLFAFQTTIDRIAGASQLEISASETGFEESVLERVQSVAGVRVAVPVIEAVVPSGLTGEGNLLVLGVDMLGDRSLRQYDLEGNDDAIDDPLVFLAQPDSLIVTKPFAARNRLSTGSKITLETINGPKPFTVRGIMATGGLTSAFGGNLGVMDIYAAQKMFGRGPRFDRIDVALRDGVTLAEASARLKTALGPGFQVDTPTSRGAQFEAIAGVYRVVANITSLFALFIGMFIIYNTFAVAVGERRAEIGILRALGAPESRIRWLFLVESGVAGFAGSAVGVVFGIAMARGLAGSIGDLMGEVYGMRERAAEIAANPAVIVVAIAIGAATSLAAAWIPARSAARLDPVKALQKGRYQALGEGESRVRRLAAAGLFAIAVVCAVVRAGPLLYAGLLALISAAVLVTPAAVVWIARSARPVLRGALPVEGALAADSLIQAPRRSSATVAALAMSAALVVGLAGTARASYDSILGWVDAVLNPDLFISAGEKLTERSYRFSPLLANELRAVNGVESVQMVRAARVVFRNRPVMLTVIESAGVLDRIRYPVIEGDRGAMRAAMVSGQGLIISDNLAVVERLHLGDSLELETPGGTLRLPIAGVVTDYSDQQGAILLDRAVYLRYWNDDTVNIFRVYLNKGAAAEAVTREIQARAGAHTRLFVLTNRAVRGYIQKITDQWFGLTYIQILIAVLVSVLGIANALTVSISDRRRELGILRAAGAVRSQVRRSVWMESLLVAFIGLALGFAVGAIQLYFWLQIGERDISGIRLPYLYPWTIAGALAPVVMLAAWGASLLPAESAARAPLKDALEYE